MSKVVPIAKNDPRDRCSECGLLFTRCTCPVVPLSPKGIRFFRGVGGMRTRRVSATASSPAASDSRPSS